MLQLLIVTVFLSQAPAAPDAPDEDRTAAAHAGLSDAAVARLSPEQLHDVLRHQHQPPEPPAVAAVAVIGFFATSCILIVGVLFAISRISRQRSETLRLMVEKGVPIPPELLAPRPRVANDLRRGLVLSTFGLGLGIFLLAVSDVRGMWTLGLVPLLVGVGYLVAFRLIKDEPAQPARSQQPLAS